MPGEVIRDVIIRVAVQQGDTKALAGVKAATDSVTTATQAAGRAAAVMGQEQVKHLTPVERELEKCERLIKEIGEEYARTGRKAGAELDTLIARQKDLNRVIRERDKIIGGGGDGPAPKPGQPSPGFGAAFGAATGAISRIAAPVAVISMVPAVAEQISGAVSRLGYSLFGTAQEREKKGSPFLNSLGPTNQVDGSGLMNFAGLAMNTGIGRSIVDSPLGNIPVGGILGPLLGLGSSRGFADQFQADRTARDRAEGSVSLNPVDVLANEVQLRQQQVSLLEQVHQKERTALQTELGLTEDRIRMNQQVIEAEQAKLDAAQQQFGMLDATERATFKSAAGKVKEGGLGSLSKEELGLLKGNQAFQGLFQDDAMKSADAAGWKEIVESLGLDEKIKAEESQLELNLQQKMEITADITNIDAAVNKFRDALVETQTKLAEEMVSRVRLEIARALRETKGPSGPDF